MFAIANEYDRMIDFLANDGPEERTRDQVIVDCQVWPLAFMEEGKRYARENGFSGGSFFAFIQWLATNYKWPSSTDPVASWRARAQRVEREPDEHKILSMYRSFMDQTDDIRRLIRDSALQLDAEIDRQIDMTRGR